MEHIDSADEGTGTVPPRRANLASATAKSANGPIKGSELGEDALAGSNLRGEGLDEPDR